MDLFGLDADGNTLPGHWPVQLDRPGGGSHLRTPAVSTGDGVDRIYTAGNGTRHAAYAVDAHGKRLPGWPVTFAGSQQALSEISLATGKSETLYVTTLSGSVYDRSSEVHALSPDGAEREGWPVHVGWSWYFNSPAVAGDGSVYQLSFTWNGVGSWESTLDSFSPDGSVREGWPHVFPRGQRTGLFIGPSVATEGTVYVALWDASGDYGGECTVGDEEPHSFVYAFAPTGKIKSGWPARIDGCAYATPSIADEASGAEGAVYVSTWRESSGNEQVASVYALSPHGDVKPGWPTEFASPYVSGFNDLILKPAIDGDGNVFFGREGYLHGHDPAGQPLAGYPVPAKGYARDPGIAGDGTLHYLDCTTGAGSCSVHALRAGRGPGG